jgi:ABC-type Fe3+-citrate transport system substrate-binding protein
MIMANKPTMRARNMKKSVIILFLVFVSLMASGCTFTMNQISTRGTATDVVDETSTPTATVNPTVTIPLK